VSARQLIALVVSIVATATAASGCSASRQASGTISDGDSTARALPQETTLPATSLSRDSAIAIMKRLEREPLAPGATADRQRAFEWLAANDELGGIAIDGRYLKPLEDSDYPFAGELLMQYGFGMALYRMTPEGAVSERAAQVEAGLRSVIATYRNMVQADIKLGTKFLDDLDQIRRLGRLREYIEKVDEQNR
jgi:hypothetical protein